MHKRNDDDPLLFIKYKYVAFTYHANHINDILGLIGFGPVDLQDPLIPSMS